jgi:hypothetical protein
VSPIGTLTANGWSTSRAKTIAAPAWRAQILRSDGTVRCTFRGHDTTGADVRNWFTLVPLQPGETARYQVRHPGKSRFNTFGRRP